MGHPYLQCAVYKVSQTPDLVFDIFPAKIPANLASTYSCVRDPSMINSFLVSSIIRGREESQSVHSDAVLGAPAEARSKACLFGPLMRNESSHRANVCHSLASADPAAGTGVTIKGLPLAPRALLPWVPAF